MPPAEVDRAAEDDCPEAAEIPHLLCPLDLGREASPAQRLADPPGDLLGRAPLGRVDDEHICSHDTPPRVDDHIRADLQAADANCVKSPLSIAGVGINEMLSLGSLRVIVP